VDDLIKMSTYYLDVNKPLAIRNRLMFLLPHFTLCHGENVRALQLADLFSIKLDNEGYSTCSAVVAVMSQGKKTVWLKRGRCFYSEQKRPYLSNWCTCSVFLHTVSKIYVNFSNGMPSSEVLAKRVNFGVTLLP